MLQFPCAVDNREKVSLLSERKDNRDTFSLLSERKLCAEVTLLRSHVRDESSIKDLLCTTLPARTFNKVNLLFLQISPVCCNVVRTAALHGSGTATLGLGHEGFGARLGDGRGWGTVVRAWRRGKHRRTREMLQ